MTTPLLVIRRFTNWSIYHKNPREERRQFAIRDLFLWTTAIAGQIALAKTATKGQAFSFSISSRDVFEIGFGLLLFTGGVVVVGLPTAFAAFGKSRRFIAFVVLALVVTPPTIFEAMILTSGGGRPDAQEYFEICVVFFSSGLGIVATMTGALWIVRQYDYRLGNPALG